MTFMNMNKLYIFRSIVIPGLTRDLYKYLYRFRLKAGMTGKKIPKKISMYFLTILAISTIFLSFPSPAFALVKKSGDIEIITDEPLFPSSIVWYPGLKVEKSIQVKNRGTGPKKVEIEAMSELVSKNLADVLQFEVKEGTKTLYGGTPSKTLKNFLDAKTLELSEVWVNDDGKAFSLIVTMPDTAGNEYQGGKASFDLRVGFPGDANSSVIISSNTATSTTAPAVLSAGTQSVRTGGGPQILGESVSPTPVPVPSAETAGNLSNQNSQGQVAGESTESPFPWDRLLIVLGLLGSGTLVAVFFFRNRL